MNFQLVLEKHFFSMAGKGWNAAADWEAAWDGWSTTPADDWAVASPAAGKSKTGKSKGKGKFYKGGAKGKDGKEVTRVVLLKNDAVTKAFHKRICSGDKIAVAVTGKFEGKGKKRLLVASKIADAPKKGKGKATDKKKKA